MVVSYASFPLVPTWLSSTRLDSVFKVFHLVVVLGTRYYFSTCSAGEPNQLSRPKNVVSTDCMPPIRQLITSLDESRE